ncbi:hypothetical protein [Vibrio coralliilyticus]|uniref:hypothetical protein n=1 Tax=Vibrio coralliilyticus TaxID=190893 RepID=UPI001E5070DD|nr:hypothetical protein [Vibrio coralliilyticus]MCC2525582.1 hypothetical protein [Vibrio coralliilyticus]
MNLQELSEQAETLDVTYSGIGENKELPRLWIEGAKLSLAGFAKGMRYTYQKVNNSLVLEPDENGKGRVSGRNRHGRTLPIIDLKIPLLDEWFGRGARIKVVFSVNKITITLHHEEQAKRQREAQCIANLKKGTLKEASICTGGGISTTAVHDGLAEAGIQGDLCWVVDSNLSYLQSAAKNSWAINDTTSFYVGKVEEVESQYFTDVDLLSFSLPCTGGYHHKV